ncbi:MAG: hypothetical protein VB049_00655 [Candidatus Pelethousia sp.]|nr:hypothetical protein [Candidatus Pelethousia sp.]
MPPDAEALRAILKQYVGPAYDRAFRNTASESVAADATRRAMELLKRACEEGVEPTKALVLRLVDDCCDKTAFFNRNLDGAPGLAQEQAAFSQMAADPPAASQRISALASAPSAPAPRSHQESVAFGNPTFPEASTAVSDNEAGRSVAASKDPSRQASNPLFTTLPPLVPGADSVPALFADDQKKKVKKPKDSVSPGSALLVMFLSLVVVVLVVLVVLLLSGGTLPGIVGSWASDFTAWFNAHIFPLF